MTKMGFKKVLTSPSTMATTIAVQKLSRLIPGNSSAVMNTAKPFSNRLINTFTTSLKLTIGKYIVKNLTNMNYFNI